MFKTEEWVTKEWEEIKEPNRHGKIKDTGVDVEELRKIGDLITTIPPKFNAHP
jgi:2-oxoglutarate dehydrogenase complex dehydrogenase (E1) component-like enzyme